MALQENGFLLEPSSRVIPKLPFDLAMFKFMVIATKQRGVQGHA